VAVSITEKGNYMVLKLRVEIKTRAGVERCKIKMHPD